jgi:hypothetical protein
MIAEYPDDPTSDVARGQLPTRFVSPPRLGPTPRSLPVDHIHAFSSPSLVIHAVLASIYPLVRAGRKEKAHKIKARRHRSTSAALSPRRRLHSPSHPSHHSIIPYLRFLHVARPTPRHSSLSADVCQQQRLFPIRYWQWQLFCSG